MLKPYRMAFCIRPDRRYDMRHDIALVRLLFFWPFSNVSLFIRMLVCSFVRSSARSFVSSFISVAHSFLQSLLVCHSLSRCFVRFVARSFTRSSTRFSPLVPSLIPPVVLPFIPSLSLSLRFALSFARSFLQSTSICSITRSFFSTPHSRHPPSHHRPSLLHSVHSLRTHVCQCGKNIPSNDSHQIIRQINKVGNVRTLRG